LGLLLVLAFAVHYQSGCVLQTGRWHQLGFVFIGAAAISASRFVPWQGVGRLGAVALGLAAFVGVGVAATWVEKLAVASCIWRG
jgi:O-antigen ligase